MFIKIKIPAGVELTLLANKIAVKGPKGGASREYPTRNLEIKKVEDSVEVKTGNENAIGRTLVGTFTAHLKNMFAGVQKPYVYKLKICGTHFPMSAKIENGEFVLTNFIGGKRLKKAKFPKEVSVKVSGEFIDVESSDLELAGMVASKLEGLTKVRAKDRRAFQDGIYLIEKPKRAVW